MIQVIPAIDIMNGKCVRLSQGDFLDKKVYEVSPVEIAKMYAGIGIERLHMVDLDGAKAGSLKNVDTLFQVASATSLVIDYGGGIRTDSDVKQVLDAGATIINISSIAVKQPQLLDQWLAEYGPDKILLGADVKNEVVSINGWQYDTNLNLFTFLQNQVDKGIRNFFCTDIQTDGMLAGPSTELYKRIISSFPTVNFIASGGVSKLDDIKTLDAIGCNGVIVGKAIYEGQITLKELEQYIADGTN